MQVWEEQGSWPCLRRRKRTGGEKVKRKMTDSRLSAQFARILESCCVVTDVVTVSTSPALDLKSALTPTRGCVQPVLKTR